MNKFIYSSVPNRRCGWDSRGLVISKKPYGLDYTRGALKNFPIIEGYACVSQVALTVNETKFLDARWNYRVKANQWGGTTWKKGVLDGFLQKDKTWLSTFVRDSSIRY